MEHTAVVIDDSKVFRFRFARTLEYHGIRIVGLADNGVLGAEQVNSLQPSLVILDYEMPVCNGLECARMIRTVNRDTKIIVISASVTPDTALPLMEAGVNSILVKPVSDTKLAEALTRLNLTDKPMSQTAYA
ncbi:response regulator transcription factor [bacterium]|nr:response regulator transcription factor [bacterium]